MTLQALSKKEERLFIDGDLPYKSLSIKYEKPKYLDEGGFGAVTYYPHQDFVAKKYFEFDPNKTPPMDMVKEIAFYRLFNHETRCLPILKSFNLKKGVAVFERGVSTLYSAYGSFTLEQVRNIMFKLAFCLRESSGQGIFHSDLKPTNLIIDVNGNVKIIDWGISEIDRAGTKTTGIGSFWYKAPELFGDYHNVLVNKSDIFSLGIIFLEILLKGLPFAGDSIDIQTRNLIKFYNGKRWSDHMGTKDPTKELHNIVMDEDTDYQAVIKAHPYLRRLSSYTADMISGMLLPNPKKRWTYDQILHSSVFDKYKIPKPLPKYLNEMDYLNMKEDWEREGLNIKLRAILLEWMFEVAVKFKMELTGYFLAVQILDVTISVLKSQKIKRNQLQVFACAALCLSGKLFMDVDDVPEDKDYVQASDNAFSVASLVKACRTIMEVQEGRYFMATIYDYYRLIVGGARNKVQIYNILLTYVRPTVYMMEPKTVAEEIATSSEPFPDKVVPKECREYLSAFKKVLR